MADQSKHGSDTGAAFVGLIGGALLIGAILYAIVVFTNKQFEGHKKGETAARAVAAESLV
jgi:hypothetical protein